MINMTENIIYRISKWQHCSRSKHFSVHLAHCKLAATGDLPIRPCTHKLSNTTDALCTELW